MRTSFSLRTPLPTRPSVRLLTALAFGLVIAKSGSANPTSSERHILFEPGGTLPWRIDGDHKMEDGHLVLGGAKPIRFRVAELLGDYFLFRMDYRASIAGQPQPAEKRVIYPDPQSGAVMQSISGSRLAPGVTFQYKNFLSSASCGLGFNEARKEADQWDRVVFIGYRNSTTGNLEIAGWNGSSTSSESDIMKTRPIVETMCVARRFGDICINVPAGSQLIIREAILDGDVSHVSGQALLWVLILLGSVFCIAACGFIWHLRRRSRLAT
jgi:hypothetical protein